MSALSTPGHGIPREGEPVGSHVWNRCFLASLMACNSSALRRAAPQRPDAGEALALQEAATCIQTDA